VQKGVGPQAEEPKYAYTLAFYLNQKGVKAEAVKTLKGIVEKYRNTKTPRSCLRISRSKQSLMGIFVIPVETGIQRQFAMSGFPSARE